MTTISIEWRAFQRNVAEPTAFKTFEVEQHDQAEDLRLCEDLFRATNLYAGKLWDAMQPLPEDRSHTSLSVIFDQGDRITIDGRTYEVASLGFVEVEAL